MNEYRQELERRVGQFSGYLKLMHRRAHIERHGCCFIIFSARPPSGGTGDDDELDESASLAPELELVEMAIDEGTSWQELPSFDHSDNVDSPAPDDAWRDDDAQPRFVQFAFDQETFMMDLPVQTLFRPGALDEDNGGCHGSASRANSVDGLNDVETVSTILASYTAHRAVAPAFASFERPTPTGAPGRTCCTAKAGNRKSRFSNCLRVDATGLEPVTSSV